MGGYGGTCEEVSGEPLGSLRGYLVRGFLGTYLREDEGVARWE